MVNRVTTAQFTLAMRHRARPGIVTLAAMALLAVVSAVAFGRYEPVTLKAPLWLRRLDLILILDLPDRDRKPRQSYLTSDRQRSYDQAIARKEVIHVRGM